MKIFFENFEITRKHKIVIISLIFYIWLLFYYLIAYHLPFDKYIGFFLLLNLFLFTVKLKDFLKPIFAIIYVVAIYSAMHNISGKGVIYYQYVIKIEKFLFGTILPHFLQKNIGSPKATFLDIVCITVYLLHFVFPIITGLFFLLKEKKYFGQFLTDLIILSLTGFGIYLLIPTAPPWIASQKGFISQVHKYIFKLAEMFSSLNLKEIYFKNIGNMYGAMPSIHSAYPTLIYLHLGKYKKRNFIIFLPFLLFIFFALIYLGEHYAVDVIAGILFTLLIFFIGNKS